MHALKLCTHGEAQVAEAVTAPACELIGNLIDPVSGPACGLPYQVKALLLAMSSSQPSVAAAVVDIHFPRFRFTTSAHPALHARWSAWQLPGRLDGLTTQKRTQRSTSETRVRTWQRASQANKRMSHIGRLFHPCFPPPPAASCSCAATSSRPLLAFAHSSTIKGCSFRSKTEASFRGVGPRGGR